MFATKIADEVDLSELEPDYDERNKRRKITPPEPVEFSLLPPSKANASDPATSTEPASGEKEDDLAIEDLSDVELYEGCNNLTAPAGSTGVKP